jgi:hypothetical protein
MTLQAAAASCWYLKQQNVKWTLQQQLSHDMMCGRALPNPICLQAFGAGNYHMMSATLVRAQLVCAVSVLPTLLLWGSGRLAQLLPALGQQEDIAQPASRCAPSKSSQHSCNVTCRSDRIVPQCVHVTIHS